MSPVEWEGNKLIPIEMGLGLLIGMMMWRFEFDDYFVVIVKRTRKFGKKGRTVVSSLSQKWDNKLDILTIEQIMEKTKSDLLEFMEKY